MGAKTNNYPHFLLLSVFPGILKPFGEPRAKSFKNGLPGKNIGETLTRKLTSSIAFKPYPYSETDFISILKLGESLCSFPL